MEHGRTIAPCEIKNLVIGVDVFARALAAIEIAAQRWRFQQGPCQLDTTDDGAAVGLGTQIVRLDQRMLPRIGEVART